MTADSCCNNVRILFSCFFLTSRSWFLTGNAGASNKKILWRLENENSFGSRSVLSVSDPLEATSGLVIR